MTTRRLPSTRYLAFPFRLGPAGAEATGRQQHVRDQIEQVLFTLPRERLFRPEFGIGVQQLVFEPMALALWDMARKRLLSSLSEALQGEVDPRTLEVIVPDGAVAPDPSGDGTLQIIIRYQLATVGERVEERFTLSSRGVGDG